jgi:hypothetical protein
MVCVGLAVGIPIVFWSRRFAVNLIEGLTVNPSVPIVFGSLAMLAIALVAAYLPARRAARVDPMEAVAGRECRIPFRDWSGTEVHESVAGLDETWSYSMATLEQWSCVSRRDSVLRGPHQALGKDLDRRNWR